MVAGTHSGTGKTTVATGLMAAFAARGVRVAPAKVGPDYIDPGYHALATGRPGRNLDAWMCGADAIPGLAARAARDADLLVVEGVMGLFDGAADPPGVGSTAHVARLLEAPIVLVVDARAMSGSVAALVHGFATFDPAVAVAGVVLNRVGSDRHEAMLRDALTPLGLPVLGALRRSPDLEWRDRHLGLVPVVEHPAEIRRSLDRLADLIAASCDLAAIEALASAAPPLTPAPPPAPTRQAGPPVRIALAAGAAFSFAYPDNTEALEAAGAEIVPFDPVTDPGLPERVGALVVGGGFPEIYARQLGANRRMLDDVRRRVAGGLVTWAECAGLLWLGRALDGVSMVGALPCEGRMTDRLTLGYRSVRTGAASPLGPAGTVLRGHEFHYSVTDPPGDGLGTVGGYVTPTLAASYLHLHLGAAPDVATALVGAARRFTSATPKVRQV